jgi:hypothetical protein
MRRLLRGTAAALILLARVCASEELSAGAHRIGAPAGAAPTAAARDAPADASHAVPFAAGVRSPAQPVRARCWLAQLLHRSD